MSVVEVMDNQLRTFVSEPPILWNERVSPMKVKTSIYDIQRFNNNKWHYSRFSFKIVLLENNIGYILYSFTFCLSVIVEILF